MFGKDSKIRQMQQGEKPDFPDPFGEQKPPEAFVGDKPPEREQQKPPEIKFPGDEMNLNTGYQAKRKKISMMDKAGRISRRNPAISYATYDLGKGIIGKITNLRMPSVVGGRAGFRSAKQ